MWYLRLLVLLVRQVWVRDVHVEMWVWQMCTLLRLDCVEV